MEDLLKAGLGYAEPVWIVRTQDALAVQMG